MSDEICICAAVIAENGMIIRGHRHGDCIKALIERDLGRKKTFDGQGFITSNNRFVNRKEGLLLQKEAEIESVAEGGYRGTNLYSEDLY